jgi:hypothetical protein
VKLAVDVIHLELFHKHTGTVQQASPVYVCFFLSRQPGQVYEYEVEVDKKACCRRWLFNSNTCRDLMSPTPWADQIPS